VSPTNQRTAVPSTPSSVTISPSCSNLPISLHQSLPNLTALLVSQSCACLQPQA
jgi:hypothetical protein